MACNSLSEEVVINRSYNFIQGFCDRDKAFASAPKSAYKAEKNNNLWFVRIEGYRNNTYYDSGAILGSPVKKTSRTVLTVDGMEKENRKPNPDFGMPKFNSFLGIEEKDNSCGTGQTRP